MRTELPTSSPKRRRSGVWSTLAYFTVVTLVVVGVYWATDSGPGPTAATVAAESPTPSTAITGNVVVESPSYIRGEEPIADAAEVILPSVVSIQTTTGLGAGVIYDRSGLILTAAHVVGDEETVRVRLDNGDQVTGTVLGAVSDFDIAVVRIEVGSVTAAVFNLDKPRVGQLAIAVGSPWGLESTVTAGIVSAVDQANCAFDGCFSMVQTDAAINPGNSGGPLVDRLGRVIGINVSIFTESGASDGVGFAVPSSTAMFYADAIVSGESVDTAFLGVSGDSNLEGQAGARITEVFPGTAAEAAGIQVDDVVVLIDGVRIQGSDDLAAQIRAHQPGDMVEVVLLRDGEEVTIEVTLGVRSEDFS